MNNNETNGFPRRSCLWLNKPAETAIRTAMQEVEKVGADVRLTDAIIALDKAFNLVADYIDEKETQNESTNNTSSGQEGCEVVEG